MKIETRPYLFRASKTIQIHPKEFFDLISKEKALELIYEEFSANYRPVGNDFSKKDAENMFNNLILNNQKEAKYKGHSLYFSCPYCGKFHLETDYFVPNTSWEDLIDKYKEDIFMFFITSINFYGRRYLTTIKETLFCLVQESKKDDNNNNIMGDCLLEKNKRRFVPITEFLRNDDGSLKCICPDCGANIKTNKVFSTFNNWSKWFPDEYFVKSLTREPSWFWDNVIPYNYEIFEKEEEDTVCLSIINRRIFPNVYGTPHIETTNQRFVFNTKTGMAYAFREIRLDNKKPIIKDEQRITNITYKTNMNSYKYYVPVKVAEETIKVILRKKGLEQSSISLNNIVKNSTISISEINIANRYGYYGQDFFDLFDKVSNYDDYNNYTISKYYRKKLKDMQENQMLLASEFKRRKISSKTSRKLIIKNPMLMFLEKRIRQLGFKDINVINYLLENAKVLSTIKLFWKESIPEYYENVNYDNCFISFFTDYCKIKSEKEIAKKIVESAQRKSYILNDTIQMYNTICKKAEINNSFKEYLFKGKLEEIHDKLSLTCDLLKGRDFFINYEKKEVEKYCLETDKYYFELAKKSSDMKKVGNTMHICVGSYNNRAFSKNCIIVFMKEKRTNEPAVCIEISPDGKKIIQAKDYCNQRVTSEKLPDLKAYVRALKLNDNCYDISNLYDNITPCEIKKSTDIEGYNICEKEKLSEKIYIESDLQKRGLCLKEEKKDTNIDNDFPFF